MADLMAHHGWDTCFAYYLSRPITRAPLIILSDLCQAQLHSYKFYERWATCLASPQELQRRREIAYYSQFAGALKGNANG